MDAILTKHKDKLYTFVALGSVDDKEGSPDIKTGCYDKKIRDNDFAIQDVEFVTYDGNSPESLVDFLLRTKLPDDKAYDEMTTILCHIHKVTQIPSMQELNRQLLTKNQKIKSPVVILGKADPEKEIYRMARTEKWCLEEQIV